MTRVLRLLAAALLLVALTGATSRGCAGEAGPAPKQQGNADDSGVRPGPKPSPKPTTKPPCPQRTPPPQRANPDDRDFYLLSEATSRTAHVYIAIDGRKMIDEEQPMPSRIHLVLHPDECLDFTVTAIRYPSTVRCAIMGADGRIIDRYPRPGQRPTQHAICGLAALREKA